MEFGEPAHKDTSDDEARRQPCCAIHYLFHPQIYQGAIRGGQELPSVVTFGIGGIAGLVTVYTTMPFE